MGLKGFQIDRRGRGGWGGTIGALPRKKKLEYNTKILL